MSCELGISGIRHGMVALQARMSTEEVDACGICPKSEELLAMGTSYGPTGPANNRFKMFVETGESFRQT